MSSGEETLKSESGDSAVRGTLKEVEPCETSSRRKKHRSKSKPENDYANRKAPLLKNEIILLKELVKFREEFGNDNRWKEFHKRSELQNEYSDKQMGRKMRRMKEKYKSTRKPPPPDADHRQVRIFELSKLLWGNAPPRQQPAATAQTRRGKKRKSSADAAVALPNPEDFPRLSEFFGDRKVPEILRSNWVLMGSDAAIQFEKQWRNLYVKEVSLMHEKLVLKQEICLMLSEIINRDFLAVQSSSPEKKNIEEKGTCQVTYSDNDAELSNDNSDDLVDKEECDHESKEKDCEQERFTKMEVGGCKIVEDEESEEVMECLPIEDKIENPPSENNLPSFDGVESDFPASHERDVVDGDSGSNKKKTSREKDHKKEKRVDVMNTLPSGVEIEDLAKGDPNGKLASRGMKVKVHFTAKLKDTEYVYESTINKGPRRICLGDEAMIDGFSFGVDGMRVGGKRRLIIPPSLGFGEEGFENIIPPNSWLEYEVQLIDVRN